jgi:hypothetical protein
MHTAIGGVSKKGIAPRNKSRRMTALRPALFPIIAAHITSEEPLSQ